MPIQKQNPHPERHPVTEGFIASEWVTTNGFDVEYYLSDETTIAIVEADDGSGWTLTNFGTGEITSHTSRLAGMNAARDYVKAHGLRIVPSPEQRAAKWYKGTDFDYTANHRDASVGMTLIKPGEVAARQAAEKAASATPTPSFDADKAARDLNAMMLAAKLNAMLKGEPS